MNDQKDCYKNFTAEHFDITIPRPGSDVCDIKSNHQALDVVRKEGDEIKHSVVHTDPVRLDAEQDVRVDVEDDYSSECVLGDFSLTANRDHVEKYAKTLKQQKDTASKNRVFYSVRVFHFPEFDPQPRLP